MSVLFLAAAAPWGVSAAAANALPGAGHDPWVVGPVSGGVLRPPRISPTLRPGVERKLADAFRLARAHLESHPACRSLFRDLDRPGLESLEQSVYVPAPGVFEQRLCGRGVSAYTELGSSVTYVCRSFGRLADPRAAMTLIHEALHHAGMPESREHPRMLSSVEINALVASTCRL